MPLELVASSCRRASRPDLEQALLAAGCASALHVALEHRLERLLGRCHSGCCGASALTRSRTKAAARTSAARTTACRRCRTPRCARPAGRSRPTLARHALDELDDRRLASPSFHDANKSAASSSHLSWLYCKDAILIAVDARLGRARPRSRQGSGKAGSPLKRSSGKFAAAIDNAIAG